MKRVKGATISYEQIAEIFARIPLTQLTETEMMVNEDHWNNGNFWIGWRPVPDENGNLSEAQLRQWEFVRKSFTQNNVIGSNVNRLEGAILGNEPDFDIVPRKSEALDDPVAEAARTKSADETYFEEIDEIFVNWWTQTNAHQSFKDLCRNKAQFGKYAVLTYIPPGYLEPKTVAENTGTEIVTREVFALGGSNWQFEEALKRIKIDVIHYSNFINQKDAEFGTEFVIVKLNDERLLSGNLISRFGVFFVDTDNRSYFRIVDQNNRSSELSCDLSGNNLCLAFGEYHKALVTDSVKKLQNALNHAETGSNYALANINYPETTFINAAPIEQTDKNNNSTGKPAQPKQGLGVYRFLRGLIQESINGVSYTTPQIHERAGADPEKFSKEAEVKARKIDMLMGMGFKHLADSEYASGDSKAKSMDDLDILLSDYETAMNTLGTRVVENVIRLAFNITGNTNRNRDFNVLFKVNMSQGKLTNEDKAGMREEVATGLRSKENYMLIAKVSDNPVNEQQRIAANPPLEHLKLEADIEATKNPPAAPAAKPPAPKPTGT